MFQIIKKEEKNDTTKIKRNKKKTSNPFSY